MKKLASKYFFMKIDYIFYIHGLFSVFVVYCFKHEIKTEKIYSGQYLNANKIKYTFIQFFSFFIAFFSEST